MEVESSDGDEDGELEGWLATILPGDGMGEVLTSRAVTTAV